MMEEIQGKGVSSGKTSGRIRIINEESQLSSFQEGEILVIRNTAPSMVFEINKAGAIISEVGGMNSHPAILARELGIPAIICSDALSKLKEWGEAEIDGLKGTITRRS
ncbi:MAG: PEP-utilizing enzyme [Candidatus Woesearchaeota archaeon]